MMSTLLFDLSQIILEGSEGEGINIVGSVMVGLVLEYRFQQNERKMQNKKMYLGIEIWL